MTDSKKQAPRHFLDLKDLAPETLTQIIDTAQSTKGARSGLPKAAVDPTPSMNGQMLLMLFEQPSTRTRISFDVAMRQLGGGALTLDGAQTQLGRGESIEDTARVLSRYSDLIMARVKDHDSLLALANHATVPVINALTNRSHPCQIVADLMTLKEHFGRLDDLRLAWLGDGNNVATSVIEAAALLGLPLHIACPEGHEPADEVMAWAADRKAPLTLSNDPDAAVIDAHVVITDTWTSMGTEGEEARRRIFMPFQVDEARMAKAHPEAVFLHCLPAHRGDEVTDAVMDGPQSLVFDEAENRLHAQKAIIKWCLGF